MSGTLVRARQRGEPGLKGAFQLAEEAVLKQDMLREVPISSDDMVDTMMRFCTCDHDGQDKATYADVIDKVLRHADKHKMSVRDQERLLELIDEDKDGDVSPIETAAAQYYLTSDNQGYEAHGKHARISFHGDVSKMKVCVRVCVCVVGLSVRTLVCHAANSVDIYNQETNLQVCIDEMFSKLQMRSLSFLRMCLERSGKPVLASDVEFTRVAPSNNPAPATDADTGQDADGHARRAHFEDKHHNGAATQISPASGKKMANLQSWLTDADEAATLRRSLKGGSKQYASRSQDCMNDFEAQVTRRSSPATARDSDAFMKPGTSAWTPKPSHSMRRGQPID